MGMDASAFDPAMIEDVKKRKFGRRLIKPALSRGMFATESTYGQYARILLGFNTQSRFRGR